ncbi:MAG: UvrB/UvrC motif-containing protein [Elusimicrobia bacterium]|nr:UvrB/UvrC motif-containing protein [Elusimicrobiota bacterium]
MLCSRCGKNEASVHFKQIVNNQVAQIDLCVDCAKSADLPGAAVSPIFDLLSKLGGLPPGREARPKDLLCRACGLRYSSFRETGMLGCPSCYESFAGPLSAVLKQIHGASRHGGKAPAGSPDRRRIEEDAAKLRELLKKAVAAEDFEEAARLRDRLRALGRD